MLFDEVGVEANSHEEVCGIAKSYFVQLFKTKHGNYDMVMNCIQLIISCNDNIKLLSHISKAELYEDLMHMHPDKSPGPDGFNPAFYQHF